MNNDTKYVLVGGAKVSNVEGEQEFWDSLRNTPVFIRAGFLRVLRGINAAAEADMLAGNPITGAHHRAIEKAIRILTEEK